MRKSSTTTRPTGGRRQPAIWACATPKAASSPSLDSDDYWQPDFLSTSLYALEKHTLDFVFLNWREDTGAESYLAKDARKPDWQRYQQQADGEWRLLDAALVRQLFVSTCPAPSSALVIRRSSLSGGWNEQMLIADDWHLMRNLVLQRPARAAFTLAPHWTKCVQDDNIYDGRAHLEIIQRLGFHDEKLMAQLFAPYLSRAEMRQIRQRLAMHYFSYSYFDWKLNGTSPATFSKLAQAFRLAPLTAGRLSLVCVAQYLYKPKGHLGPFLAGQPSADAPLGRAPAQQLAARPVQDVAGI